MRARGAAQAAGISLTNMAERCAGRGGRSAPPQQTASDLEILLHPELLSQDFVQLVLQEKKIWLEDHVKSDRDLLTQVFVQHITPKPQRELPDSRWGRRVVRKVPNQTQGPRLSSTSPGESARKRPLIVFDGSSTQTGTIKLKKPETPPALGTADRLKPPPSSGNFTNPIRKLSNSPTTPVSPPGQMARSPPEKETPKLHTSQSVKLKRLTPSEGDAEIPPELKSPEMKKKIHPITWP